MAYRFDDLLLRRVLFALFVGGIITLFFHLISIFFGTFLRFIFPLIYENYDLVGFSLSVMAIIVLPISLYLAFKKTPKNSDDFFNLFFRSSLVFYSLVLIARGHPFFVSTNTRPVLPFPFYELFELLCLITIVFLLFRSIKWPSLGIKQVGREILPLISAFFFFAALTYFFEHPSCLLSIAFVLFNLIISMFIIFIFVKWDKFSTEFYAKKVLLLVFFYFLLISLDLLLKVFGFSYWTVSHNIQDFVLFFVFSSLYSLWLLITWTSRGLEEIFRKSMILIPLPGLYLGLIFLLYSTVPIFLGIIFGGTLDLKLVWFLLPTVIGSLILIFVSFFSILIYFNLLKNKKSAEFYAFIVGILVVCFLLAFDLMLIPFLGFS